MLIPVFPAEILYTIFRIAASNDDRTAHSLALVCKKTCLWTRRDRWRTIVLTSFESLTLFAKVLIRCENHLRKKKLSSDRSKWCFQEIPEDQTNTKLFPFLSLPSLRPQHFIENLFIDVDREGRPPSEFEATHWTEGNLHFALERHLRLPDVRSFGYKYTGDDLFLLELSTILLGNLLFPATPHLNYLALGVEEITCFENCHNHTHSNIDEFDCFGQVNYALDYSGQPEGYDKYSHRTHSHLGGIWCRREQCRYRDLIEKQEALNDTFYFTLVGSPLDPYPEEDRVFLQPLRELMFAYNDSKICSIILYLLSIDRIRCRIQRLHIIGKSGQAILIDEINDIKRGGYLNSLGVALRLKRALVNRNMSLVDVDSVDSHTCRDSFGVVNGIDPIKVGLPWEKAYAKGITHVRYDVRRCSFQPLEDFVSTLKPVLEEINICPSFSSPTRPSIQTILSNLQDQLGIGDFVRLHLCWDPPYDPISSSTLSSSSSTNSILDLSSPLSNDSKYIIDTYSQLSNNLNSSSSDQFENQLADAIQSTCYPLSSSFFTIPSHELSTLQSTVAELLSKSNRFDSSLSNLDIRAKRRPFSDILKLGGSDAALSKSDRLALFRDRCAGGKGSWV